MLSSGETHGVAQLKLWGRSTQIRDSAFAIIRSGMRPSPAPAPGIMQRGLRPSSSPTHGCSCPGVTQQHRSFRSLHRPLHGIAKRKIPPYPWLCLPGAICCKSPTGAPICRVTARFLLSVKPATASMLLKVPLLSSFPLSASNWFQPPELSAMVLEGPNSGWATPPSHSHPSAPLHAQRPTEGTQSQPCPSSCYFTSDSLRS